MKLAIAKNVPSSFAAHGVVTQLAKGAFEKETFVACATRSLPEVQRSNVLPVARQSACSLEHHM